MIDLTSDKAILNLHTNNSFPRPCLVFIQNYMQQIYSILQDEPFPPLGHWFFILEANDQLVTGHDDSQIFSCASGTFYPEYIERYTFDDGSSLFKIYVMLDNECSMTFFTLQGFHSEEAEHWLISNSIGTYQPAERSSF